MQLKNLLNFTKEVEEILLWKNQRYSIKSQIIFDKKNAKVISTAFYNETKSTTLDF